ncbi:MAG: CorA family divalent cation transporter, partial [bacterium]|nr:CorA family divalent cation transporter [bacterium]
QAIDVLETYRDMAGQLMEAYLSGVNNKMNEIMKLLTVISTIFIPLSFLSSVYGMNFEYMPELKFYWGYPVFWFVMLALGFGMLRYFRQKKWV